LEAERNGAKIFSPQERYGWAAEGNNRRVIFADFSSRMPGKIFHKNSGAIGVVKHIIYSRFSLPIKGK
jgi:hypothetical protein